MLHFFYYIIRKEEFPMGRASRQKKIGTTGTNGTETKGESRPVGGKTLRCYKCGKEVSEYDTECPHCGAQPPKFNPAILARILLGIILGIILYIYFM
jgi:rubrerythrin